MGFSGYSPYCVPFNNNALRTARKIRMVCAGAGFAGLTLAYKVIYENKLLDLIDFTIYEREKGVGGTWLINRYPGLKCDVPIHAYNMAWAPKHDWTKFYAGGLEIRQYIEDAARKFELEQYIQFESKVVEATWDEKKYLWKLKVQQGRELVDDECEIFIGATGTQSQPNPPKIPGLQSFKGPILHTGDWDETTDCRDKKIAVIGNGSSGVQVFTALQKEAASITHYIRSPTWISLNYMSQYTRNGDGQNFEYTDEEKSNFKDYPETFLAYRKKLEDTSIRLFKNLVFEETCQALKKAFRKTLTRVMTERTKNQPDLAEKIIPTFQPWCRRLTPADGYLEALQALNAELVDTPIEAITPTGIRLEDGRETDYDVIVTATGFVNSRIAPWTMRGRNGVTMEELFKENPEAYLSICIPHLPNYFAIGCGPNYPVANGPVQSALSWICDYILRWTKKLISEDIRSICVKQDVVEAYNIYIQEIFRRTVWNRECNSWYKTGKRDEYRTGISAIYPGSLHHFREMVQCDLRGEDFDFIYGSSNRFKFLGNGLAEVDLNDDNDLAFHIDGAFKSENTI